MAQAAQPETPAQLLRSEVRGLFRELCNDDSEKARLSLAQIAKHLESLQLPHAAAALPSWVQASFPGHAGGAEDAQLSPGQLERVLREAALRSPTLYNQDSQNSKDSPAEGDNASPPGQPQNADAEQEEEFVGGFAKPSNLPQLAGEDKDGGAHKNQEDAKASPFRSALLLVDIQNDFCPPSGSLAVPGGDQIIPVVNALRDQIRWDMVALSLDWHPANHVSFAVNHPGAKVFELRRLDSGQMQVMWPAHCVQGSSGADLHPELRVAPWRDLIVRKGKDPLVDSYSAFYDNDRRTRSDLEPRLRARGVSDCFVTGLAYDFCVGSTALDARAAGFRAWVVEDCSRGVAPESSREMRRRLVWGGVGLVDSAEVKGIVERIRAGKDLAACDA